MQNCVLAGAVDSEVGGLAVQAEKGLGFRVSGFGFRVRV